MIEMITLFYCFLAAAFVIQLQYQIQMQLHRMHPYDLPLKMHLLSEL